MHPYLFRIGNFEFRIYSLMIMAAVIIGIYFVTKRAKALGWDKTITENGIIFSFIMGILGARIYYVLFNWDFFRAYPSEIPAVWHGGLAIHGGIIFAFIGAYFYCRKHKIQLAGFTDICTPFFLLGQGLGRFGNFANGEAHGVPTIVPLDIIFKIKPVFTEFWSSTLRQYNVDNTPKALTNFYQYVVNATTSVKTTFNGSEYLLKEYVPWGISFPAKFNSIIYREFGAMPIHPTFFYEAILNFIGAAVLLVLWRKDENIGSGKILSLYLIFYALIRAFVTFFRADDLMFGPLRVPHLASLLLIVVAIIWYCTLNKIFMKILKK